MGMTLDWPTAAVILGLAGLYVYHAQGQRACACRECGHDRHGHGLKHREDRHGKAATTERVTERLSEHSSSSSSSPPQAFPTAKHASPSPSTELEGPARSARSSTSTSTPPLAPGGTQWDDPAVAGHSGWDPVSGAYTDAGAYLESGYASAPPGVIPRRPRVPVPPAGSWSARLGRDGRELDDSAHALAPARLSPDNLQSALAALAPPFPASPVTRDVPEHRKKIRAKLSAQFGRWECFPCERFHHTPEALLYHIRDVHKLDIAPHLDRVGAFERAALAASSGRRCEACDRSFRLHDHFAQHMRDKHGINAWAERAERAERQGMAEEHMEEEVGEDAQEGTGWEWVTGSAPERLMSPVSPLVDVHDVLGDQQDDTEEKPSWSAVVRKERGWEDEYPALPSATTQAEPEPIESRGSDESRPASEPEPTIELDSETAARTPEIDTSGGSPPDAELVTPDGAEPAALELPPGPTLDDLFHYDEVPVDELEVGSDVEHEESEEEVEREIKQEREPESELSELVLAPASPTSETKTIAQPDLDTQAPSTPGPTGYDTHTPARAPDASRHADISGGSSLFAFTPTPHKFAWSRQHETSPLAAPRRLSTPLSSPEQGSLAASPSRFSPQDDFPSRRRFSTHDAQGTHDGGLQLERTLSSVSGVSAVSSSSATSIWGPPDNARVYIPPLPVAGPVANPDAHPGWEFWPTRERDQSPNTQHAQHGQPPPQALPQPQPQPQPQPRAQPPRLDAAYRLPPPLPRPTPGRASALANDDVWSPKPAKKSKDLRPIFDSWVTLDDAQPTPAPVPAKQKQPVPAPVPAKQQRSKGARTASPAHSTASGSTSASSAKTRKGRRVERERLRRDDLEATYATPVPAGTGADEELYGGW